MIELTARVTLASNVIHSLHTARALETKGWLEHYISPVLFKRRTALARLELVGPIVARRCVEHIPGTVNSQPRLTEGVSRLISSLPMSVYRRVPLSIVPYDVWCAANRLHSHVFHYHSSYFSRAAEKMKRRGSFVVCDHRSNFPEWNGSRDPLRLRLLREFELADLIITPSDFSRDTFISGGISGEKVHVVPLGVDVERFRDVRNIEDMPGNSPSRILYVGRVSSLKGVLVLADAVGRLNERRGLRFVGAVEPGIVGDVLRLCPWAEFAGFTSGPALVRELEEASVVVLPSYSDSFGLSALEAMASGRPVIVSRQSGISSVVANSGCGLVVEAGEPDDLGAAVEMILGDRHKAIMMGRAARSSAQNLSWSSYNDRLIRLYQEKVVPQVSSAA